MPPGWGNPCRIGVVRLTMLLKLNSLLAGYSGVSQPLLDLLARCINEDLLPVVPSQGSVGASGDLAPLAHIALVLVGRGEARYRGRVLPGAEALRAAGLGALQLGPKEGLDLINGTQLSAAQALRGLIEARRNLVSAVVVGAYPAMPSALPTRSPTAASMRSSRIRGRWLLPGCCGACWPAAKYARRTWNATACRIPIRFAASPR